MELEQSRPPGNDGLHSSPMATKGRSAGIAEHAPVLQAAPAQPGEQATNVCADASPGVLVLERRRIDQDLRYAIAPD